MKRFLLVDDHPVFRQGLAALLRTCAEYEIVAEANDIESALEAIERDAPHIVIVDLTLKNQNGLDLVRLIREKENAPFVLVISMHDESVYAERSVDAGAGGYVMKHAPPEIILEAVDTVLSGRIYFSPDIQQKILEARFSQIQKKESSLIDRLSKRELEILRFVGEGYGATEISKMLNLSVKTVHTYRDHLKEKLQFSTSQEVRRFAIKWCQSQNG